MNLFWPGNSLGILGCNIERAWLWYVSYCRYQYRQAWSTHSLYLVVAGPPAPPTSPWLGRMRFKIKWNLGGHIFGHFFHIYLIQPLIQLKTINSANILTMLSQVIVFKEKKKNKNKCWDFPKYLRVTGFKSTFERKKMPRNISLSNLGISWLNLIFFTLKKLRSIWYLGDILFSV